MGIDVYLKWTGMTEGEKEAQSKCWGGGRCVEGIGYLREAYDFYGFLGKHVIDEDDSDELQAHADCVADGRVFTEYADGTPYVTRFLCQEAFDSNDRTAEIPATKLRERLPHALALNQVRNRPDRRVIDWLDQALRDFVELAEKKEAETGEYCIVVVNA